jgi:hypothetical protein
LYYAGDQRFGAPGVSQSLGTYKPFSDNALPTLADVPEIFHLVKAIENGETIAEGLKRLISPGTTLGGARPKAHVAIDSVPWVIKDAPNKYRLARSSRKRDGLARHDHAGHSPSYAQCVGVTKTPVFAEPARGKGLRASCVVANHKAGI